MQGGSYHGYAITDFYKIDPRFGSNGEFRDLVRTHTSKRHEKWLWTWFFNHCGSNHWWMKDLPSKDWVNNGGVYMPTNHATVSVMDVHASPSERNTFFARLVQPGYART